jgi:hypothetical protein
MSDSQRSDRTNFVKPSIAIRATSRFAIRAGDDDTREHHEDGRHVRVEVEFPRRRGTEAGVVNGGVEMHTHASMIGQRA